MSGTALLRLAETKPSPATRRLAPNPDLPALHATLAAEITAGLTAEHAAILGQPVAGSDGWQWFARGNDFCRYVDLPPDGRRALLAACGSILSDIRRLSEGEQAPALRDTWPGLREVPSLNALFAVDGRPVLVDWGHAPPNGSASPLAEFDDGIAFVPLPRRSWTAPLVALASIALFALAAGLLLPAAARWAIPAPAMCQALPGQLDALRARNEAEMRGKVLVQLLATINDDIGRKQLLCPLPAMSRPPRSTPVPPPSPPPRRAELPESRWNQHDLTMLEGCWHNQNNMETTDDNTHIRRTVPNWQLCFDRSGHGQQTLHWSDGVVCHGPLEASFNGQNQLVLTDRDRCRSAGRFLYQGNIQCTRVSDTEASCVRTDTDGPLRGSQQQGRFVR